MPAADVTVVVPTRNRPGLLKRALDSIVSQTFGSYEVFVVDDGSSPEHAEAYRASLAALDDRFHLLQPVGPGQSGSGPSASRNRGIEAGQGRYVAFVDDDDQWVWSDHLKAAVTALDETGAALYCGDMQGFRGDELVIETWFVDRAPLVSGQRFRTDPSMYRVTRSAFVEAARQRVVHPNMLVVKRQLVEQVGGFLTRLHFAEDQHFGFRLADNVEEVVFCDRPVARYRLPEGNCVSLNTSRVDQDLQTLAGAQHLRMTARSTEVRKQARNLEAWTLRHLSDRMKENHRPGAALALALQSFVVRPALGSAAQIAKTLW